jgi:acyl dehydratase
MATAPIALDEYRQFVGRRIGVSRWFLVDQKRIDEFARVTEDEQFIHVDPQAAARSPFGGAIAHGFLSLSLLSAMAYAAVPPIAGSQMAINYGLNSVRFVTAVASGKRVRGVFTLNDIRERSPGQWQSTFAVTVEIEAAEKPAMVAEWLTLTILAPPVA